MIAIGKNVSIAWKHVEKHFSENGFLSKRSKISQIGICPKLIFLQPILIYLAI